MALELSLWLIVLAVGLISYFLGIWWKTHFLFLFGCVLMFGAGALLFAFNGLVVGHYYDLEGSLGSIVLDSSNVGVLLLSFIFLGWGVISALVFDFNPQVRTKSPFHY